MGYAVRHHWLTGPQLEPSTRLRAHRPERPRWTLPDVRAGPLPVARSTEAEARACSPGRVAAQKPRLGHRRGPATARPEPRAGAAPPGRVFACACVTRQGARAPSLCARGPQPLRAAANEPSRGMADEHDGPRTRFVDARLPWRREPPEKRCSISTAVAKSYRHITRTFVDDPRRSQGAGRSLGCLWRRRGTNGRGRRSSSRRPTATQ